MDMGISIGKHYRDENCERIKLSKVLHDFGMKVASVSLLCQDHRVFIAMNEAGTPCPFEGKIGKEAMSQWNKYDVERPDYNTYVKKLENRSRIDEELLEIAKQEEAEKIRKEQEELAKKIEEEKKKLATLKEQEEVDEEINIIIIDTVPVNVHK